MSSEASSCPVAPDYGWTATGLSGRLCDCPGALRLGGLRWLESGTTEVGLSTQLPHPDPLIYLFFVSNYLEIAIIMPGFRV